MSDQPSEPRTGRRWPGVTVIVVIAVTAWLNQHLIALPLADAPIVWAWLATLAAILLALAVIGVAVSGQILGVVIDARNRVSLSKAQAVAWTVLTISAVVAYATVRTRIGLPALDFDIPKELLIVMGISAVSLVATPAVLSLKAAQQPSQRQSAVASTVGMRSVAGLVAGRSFAAQASWLDMFRGDEVGNAASVDLSKVQQFLITLVLLAVYASMVGTALASPVTENFATLPGFSENVAWLLGISHASYIGYKAVPHAATGPAPIVEPAVHEDMLDDAAAPEAPPAGVVRRRVGPTRQPR